MARNRQTEEHRIVDHALGELGVHVGSARQRSKSLRLEWP